MENDRSRENETVRVILVCDQNYIFLAELGLPILSAIRYRDILFSPPHRYAIYDICLSEGMMPHGRHKLNLAFRQHYIEHVPSGLARELDVNVAETTFSDLFESLLTLLHYLCLGPDRLLFFLF